MKKGFLSPFTFLAFYVVFFVLVTTMMAGTGWTGITGDSEFDTSCGDLLGCTGSFFDNLSKLLTFQSEYDLFNMALLVFYFLLVAAAIGLLAGA